MNNANALILELVKGLIEADDKKTLGAYLQKPEEESQSGESQMPELSEDELAELGAEDEMEA